jgi:tetraacyldisaccharide 4'-kinase
VLEQFPVDCMILDDGFQHRALQRDVDLVLLDATDATGLDAMFPAGRLREPLRNLERATAVLITRAEFKEGVEAVRHRLQAIRVPFEDCIEAVFKPHTLLSVPGDEMRPLAWCRGKKVWLVSGIGNNESFRGSAASLGPDIRGETVFRDHHHYRADDVREIRTKAQAADVDIVLTTEKDAAKLPSFLAPGDPWWALRLQPELVRGEERLRNLVVGGADAR